MLSGDWHAVVIENVIQGCCQPRGAIVQFLLQARPFILQMPENRKRRRHRQWMLAEGARDESLRHLRLGTVAIGPCASVDAVQISCGAGDDPDGHAAAEYLSICREIR